ncbi:putative permease [Angulomicrobium tetraedrale]|uniref:Putative permease n=1 Tax=Ancylobacter tetraedralis TaxID=217068 RepID=A0A839ZEA9_9HYPH|nr:AEC family transporter [Ancylobacter tetraedralis]MBB3773143.1 putative permease [Ancylobacter tetraedralis]
MHAIIQDIVSIFFVLALGYLAGKQTKFTQDQAGGFNQLVLNYCLPALLFSSIANSSRDTLFSDTRTLTAAVCVLLGWYILAFVVAKVVFGHDRREAGIAGLSAGAPTVGFLGMAVLMPLFGGTAALSVAIMALVVNVVLVPLGMFFVAPAGTRPAAAILHAVKEPVVLAPLAAVLLVICGFRAPEIVQAPLALIGHATSGVAVFAAGLVLSAHRFELDLEVVWNAVVKIILMPATMLAVALWLGIAPEKVEEVVLLAALPPAFSGIVIAGRFQTYVSPASSTLIVSVLGFAVAAPIWIALVKHIVG